MNEKGQVVGFFSLSLSFLPIPETSSNSKKKKMKGFGRTEAKAVPCYLLGQLARNNHFSHKDLSLSDILLDVTNYISGAQDIIGGRFIAIDCTKELVNLYEQEGFILINECS